MKLYAYMNRWCELRGQDLHTLPHDKLESLHFNRHDWTNDPDYTLVGHAEVQVTLLPRAECVGRQVATLRAQQQKLRAESEAQVTRIEQQINSLLCIEGAATEVAQ